MLRLHLHSVGGQRSKIHGLVQREIATLLYHVGTSRVSIRLPLIARVVRHLQYKSHTLKKNHSLWQMSVERKLRPDSCEDGT